MAINDKTFHLGHLTRSWLTEQKENKEENFRPKLAVFIPNCVKIRIMITMRKIELYIEVINCA